MGNDLWIKIGCYLTGYNYRLLKESGEASKKSLKKYTSALLIISIIWAANGFNFAKRYLDSNLFGSILASIIMVIIIIQIERQIILSVRPKLIFKSFRTILAILMAIIGSVIIDQILFNKDLDELKKDNETHNKTLQSQFNSSNLTDSLEIEFKKEQISNIDSISTLLTTQMIKIGGNRQTKQSITDSLKNKKENEVKIDVTPLQRNLLLLDSSKTIINAEITQIKKEQQKRFEDFQKNKKPVLSGFFGEIKLLIDFINIQGTLTLVIYIFWLIFFFTLEILVLVAKISDDGNDYEKRVEYELDSNLRKIDYLTSKSQKGLS